PRYCAGAMLDLSGGEESQSPDRQDFSLGWADRRSCAINIISTSLTRISGRSSSSSRGYFPYTARICLNGHEYAKRQLDKEGVAYEPLDNGILSCEAPERLQQILDAFDEAKIEGVARKW